MFPFNFSLTLLFAVAVGLAMGFQYGSTWGAVGAAFILIYLTARSWLEKGHPRLSELYSAIFLAGGGTYFLFRGIQNESTGAFILGAIFALAAVLATNNFFRTLRGSSPTR